jgi:hypothetical protein
MKKLIKVVGSMIENNNDPGVWYLCETRRSSLAHNKDLNYISPDTLSVKLNILNIPLRF